MLTDLQKRKLMKLFSMYDANCDGSLVSQDFDAVAQKLSGIAGWSTRSPKCLTLTHQLSQKWKRLKGSADSDRDQQISIDEWFCYYDEVLADKKRYAEQVKSLQELIFDVFDANGDGELSADEWAKLLSVYNISPVYVSIIFPKLDADQDGVLKKADVLALMDEFFYSDDPNAPGNLVFGPY
ncbi:MAG: calcium-binding protein [Spirulina sp. SIO3F2]|nr:calcium-binding protein [Spirulina sp. SIO3F2]